MLGNRYCLPNVSEVKHLNHLELRVNEAVDYKNRLFMQ